MVAIAASSRLEIAMGCRDLVCNHEHRSVAGTAQTPRFGPQAADRLATCVDPCSQFVHCPCSLLEQHAHACTDDSHRESFSSPLLLCTDGRSLLGRAYAVEARAGSDDQVVSDDSRRSQAAGIQGVLCQDFSLGVDDMPFSLIVEAIDPILGHHGGAAEITAQAFLPNVFAVGWIHCCEHTAIL